MKADTERIAEKIIALFDKATIDHHMITQLAFWVKTLAETPVMAKIIYFCERILDDEV